MGRKKISPEEIKVRQRIAENLKSLLQGRSQKWLSEKTGISTSTLNGYFNATSTINAGNVEKISSAFNVKKSEIDPRFNSFEQNNLIPSNEITTVPVIGTIACGTPLFSEENVIGEMEVLAKDVKGGDYFALYAKGDSMQPKIEDGDEVLIRKQPVAENGDIVAVSINGEITLKRFKQTPSGIILIPENKSYDPIILSEDSQNYIVGKATKVSKTL